MSKKQEWIFHDILEYKTHTVDILPSIKSDHSLLKYAFALECERKWGKDLRKLNTSLLLDSDYISLINKTITHAKADFENRTNKTLAMGLLKVSGMYRVNNLHHTEKAGNKHLIEHTKSLADQIY